MINDGDEDQLNSDTNLFYELDLNKKSITKLPVYYLEEILKTNDRFPSKYDPRFSTVNNMLICNFEFSTKIYQYDFETKMTTMFNGESNITKNLRTPFQSSNTKDLAMKLQYISSGLSFYKLLWDENQSLFYRLHWDIPANAEKGINTPFILIES